MTVLPHTTNTADQASGTLATAAPAATSLAQGRLQRRRGVSGAFPELVILIGHEPGGTRATAGWQALVPGGESGYVSSPWQAIAAAISAWHRAGRPRSAGIHFDGEPHPTAIGTVAEEARATWAQRSAARSAA
jgi:hypothetical protein